ncbi:hypothetical protein [Enterococcus avium]|uniref:hypothetical protein n=1 Tax=Enterococcus avium TaxID=33945 RepID=UPI0032E52ACD
MRKVKPQNTYRHLLNFVGKEAIRPILKGFHTTYDGHVEATNGHIMLRLFHRMPANQECTVEPKELQEIEGSYPNVDRIIPTDHNALWKLDPTEAPAIVKFLKSFAKNSDVLVTAKDQQLLIADVIGDTRSTFALLDQFGDEIEFRCSVAYLTHLVSFIVDCALLPVEIRLLSPSKAVVFEGENQFIGLIMPKTTY